jgi:hypothetical protein
MSWVIPITYVICHKIIPFSKVDHLLSGVSKGTVIMRRFRIPDFPFSFKISGIENTIILEIRVKSLEAQID